MLSTQKWQSTPEVNPGPIPTTSGASVILVPIFFLAMMASTSTAGFSFFASLYSGSIKTGISPFVRISRASPASFASLAVTPVTVAVPSYTAREKATVQRTVVGFSISVQTI